jgi:hypothetical protein
MATDYKNGGILSANKRKRPGHRDADIKGSLSAIACPCCGKPSDYWVDGWKKESERGTFYSLSIKPKEARERIEHDEDISF